MKSNHMREMVFLSAKNTKSKLAFFAYHMQAMARFYNSISTFRAQLAFLANHYITVFVLEIFFAAIAMLVFQAHPTIGGFTIFAH